MSIGSGVDKVSRGLADLPAWKKSLIALATLLIITGLGLGAISGPNGSADAVHAESPADSGKNSTIETRVNPEAPTTDEFLALRSRELGDARARGLASRSLVPDGGSGPDGSLSRLSAHDAARESAKRGLRSGAELGPSARKIAPERGVGSLGAPTGSDTAVAPLGPTIGEWAPSLVRGGFSFFVAFCIGYALRTFAKISFLVLGAVFLTLASLSHFGFIEVHWDRIETQFDSIVRTFRSDSNGGLGSFLQANLPSGVMGSLGVVAGLRRR
jgi:uncharacterized membrane protein (Fun14 family)